MNKIKLTVTISVLLLFSLATYLHAGGISVDAGLSPAEGRWMVRSHVHFMQRNNDPTPMAREMKTYSLNVVAAYGMRRNITLMIKQPLKQMNMEMSGMSSDESGLADLFLMAKYGLYRKNTPDFIFGAAATLGIELPTGMEEFTSDTWDLKPGLYLSFRNGKWASDLNFSYMINGIAGENDDDINPGDELSVDFAIGRQFVIGGNTNQVLIPLVELSYKVCSADQFDGDDVANSGESVFVIAPGVKTVLSSIIIEALVQIPVSQDQEGMQPERAVGGLLGFRYMF